MAKAFSNYTAGAYVQAGTVITQGELIGVARNDIQAGDVGQLQITGIVDVPKAHGTSTAIAAGAVLYWDDTNDVATTTVGSNKKLGKSILAAGDNDQNVRVILTP